MSLSVQIVPKGKKEGKEQERGKRKEERKRKKERGEWEGAPRKSFLHSYGVNKHGPSKQSMVYTCKTRPRRAAVKWETRLPLHFFWLQTSLSLHVAAEISCRQVLGLFHNFHEVWNFSLRPNILLRLCLVTGAPRS